MSETPAPNSSDYAVLQDESQDFVPTKGNVNSEYQFGQEIPMQPFVPIVPQRYEGQIPQPPTVILVNDTSQQENPDDCWLGCLMGCLFGLCGLWCLLCSKDQRSYLKGWGIMMVVAIIITVIFWIILSVVATAAGPYH